VQADGAVTVDTTGMEIDQVLELIAQMVEQRS
jgi:cytidylate kinase